MGNDTNQEVLGYRFCILYFYGSKTQEGPRSYCVFVDPERNKHFLSCKLEFKCTNNTAEALVQGLKKAIELIVKHFKVFGDAGKIPFNNNLEKRALSWSL